MSAPFNFGSQNTAPQFGSANLPFGTPTTNQFGFGATSQPNANFSLGTTNANILGTSATANTSGLNFKPATAPTALGFGTATSTPNTGFSFGATPTAATGASGFGLMAQSSGFGAPALSTANTGFGLANTTATATSAGFWPNTSSTTTSANMFGVPATTGANLSFGTPASTAPSLGFGTTLGGGGLSFNAPTSTTSGIGFSGGIPSSSAAPPTGLSFGLSTPTNLGFGQAASTAASTLPAFGTTPTSSGFGFGSAGTTTPATNLTFSTPNAAPTLNFGATATPAATSAASLSFGATPTPNFGATATQAATSAAGLNFSNPAASTGLSFGLKTSAAATTTQKVGLGGIATTVQSTLGTSLPTTVKEVPPREQQIPNEIQQDVENFKNFIKQQKLYSSDVARCSVKDFREVESQITLLNNVIKEVESQLQRNRSLTEKLKYDTAQGLQLLEMAQRTQDTPPGLQYENVAPLNFFLNLADSFEKEMHNLKLQIENTDKYVRNFGQPATLTSQDLYTGMKRLHDTFVALAGRLQSVHSQVESQKEFYINLRKHLTHDMSNPFEKLDQKITSNQSAITQLTMRSPPKIACGPSPFNNIINTTSFPISTQQQNQPPPPYPGTSTSTGVGGFNMGSQATFGLQTTPANASLFDNNNASLKAQNFQLQKPPTGNKRGKQ